LLRLAEVASLLGALPRGARRHPALVRAGAAWVPPLVYAHAVPPRGWLAISIGGALLLVALVWTLVPLVRALGERLLWELPRERERRLARRQGLMLAVLVVANLALAALRVWTPLLAAVTIAFVVAEAVWAWRRA
jgi:hypothetical protein